MTAARRAGGDIENVDLNQSRCQGMSHFIIKITNRVDEDFQSKWWST